MRRIAIFFLICPEERSIIAESGLIAGFCDGGAPAQELVWEWALQFRRILLLQLLTV